MTSLYVLDEGIETKKYEILKEVDMNIEGFMPVEHGLNGSK